MREGGVSDAPFCLNKKPKIPSQHGTKVDTEASRYRKRYRHNIGMVLIGCNVKLDASSYTYLKSLIKRKSL